MRSLLLLLVLIASVAALTCNNGTQGTEKGATKNTLMEQRCGPGQVCGWGKHLRGEVMGCVDEETCDKGYIKAFNTHISLWCCGTHKCNSASATALGIALLFRIFFL